MTERWGMQVERKGEGDAPGSRAKPPTRSQTQGHPFSLSLCPSPANNEWLRPAFGTRESSAGAVAGLCGWVGTAYRNEPDNTAEARKNTFINTARQVTLLSGSCMMLRAATFESMRGFDETFLEAGADADLCLRLMRKNLACVYTPFASLILHGEMPQIAKADQKTRQRCYDTLRPLLAEGDPFWSPNYSYDSYVPTLCTEQKTPLACRQYDTE